MKNASKKAQWILVIITLLSYNLALALDIYYLRIDNLILRLLYLSTFAFAPYLIARFFVFKSGARYKQK